MKALRLHLVLFFFFFNDTATTEIYPLPLHDALPICDLRGPDLALERDHEARPDERGNTCPAPTCLRRTQGLEDPAPHDAPAETEDDVPEQPVPSALHGDPGQPAAHQSDENQIGRAHV